MKKLLMDAHMALVRNGEYHAAKLVLRLLRNKILRLGLDDDSCSVELLLYGMGMTPHYSRNYNVATYTLR